MQKSVELLAPAGDATCLDAALRAGADAVYFGLDFGFNARARATNFRLEDLPEVMRKIHDRGRRGYVTTNTLVFDHELSDLQRLVFAVAESGVDAVIVQDFGVARLVKRWVPSIRLHASTQMTCTDAASLRWAAELGAVRVTLARELSLKEARELASEAAMELEIFAHGALCVSYSGQCLTSEAIGGRSANRGACAQACRLPFDLILDGVHKELGDKSYLLSPKDLDASRAIPEIIESGVRAIKIEGRLKGPEYVAAATRLYRIALNAVAVAGSKSTPSDHEFPTQFYSRGASTGFLRGTDHQALIDGTTCDHIGIEAGTVISLEASGSRKWLRLATRCRLSLGDGILLQGRGSTLQELGGRIWGLRVSGSEVKSAEPTPDLWVWLGPDRAIAPEFSGQRVFRTSSPALEAEFNRVSAATETKVLVHASLQGKLGERPTLTFATDDDRRVEVELDQSLSVASTAPLNHTAVWEKLERLGGTPFQLRELCLNIPAGSILPLSCINRGRREAVAQLLASSQRRHNIVTSGLIDFEFDWPEQGRAPAGLFVTCRNLEQAESALVAGADGVYLDFLALTGVGPAIRQLREQHATSIGIATPRIRKPGEDKIDKYLLGLKPDSILLRSLGAFADAALSETSEPRAAQFGHPIRIVDFSLNITNTVAAIEVLLHDIDAFTPSFDLDTAQLEALLNSELARYAEVVIHHAMPLFHMEHCVFATLLSSGHDFRDCGRPCDRHTIALRDRKGVLLPVEADVGCRNTVFHGLAQSAADRFSVLQNAGVKRFRIELVRENAVQTRILVMGYRDLLENRCSAKGLRTRLSENGMAVVRGSLRVIG
jgi:U32 family peptidase